MFELNEIQNVRYVICDTQLLMLIPVYYLICTYIRVFTFNLLMWHKLLNYIFNFIISLSVIIIIVLFTLNLLPMKLIKLLNYNHPNINTPQMLNKAQAIINFQNNPKINSNLIITWKDDFRSKDKLIKI